MRSISRERAYNISPINSNPTSSSRQSTSASRSTNFNNVIRSETSKFHYKIPSSQHSTSNLPPKPNTSSSNSRQKPPQSNNSLLENTKRASQIQQFPKEKACKNDESLLTPCDWCGDLFSSSIMFKTPKCTSHYYCKACIVKPCNSNLSELCSLCLNYFSCIGKKVNEGTLRCNLCTKWPQSNVLNCKDHSYCLDCKEFIVKNRYRYLVNLAQCDVCVRNLEEIKKKENTGVKIDENKKELINENKDPKNINLEIRKTEKNCNPQITNSINIFSYKDKLPVGNLIEPVKKSISRRNTPEDYIKPYEKSLLYCFNCKTQVTTQEILKTKSCESHYYCKNCYESIPISKISISCTFCSAYFSQTKKNTTKNCKVCDKPSEVTELNCKLHQYCNECKEKLVKNDYKHIDKLIDCEHCVENAKRIKDHNRNRELGINTKKEIYKQDDFLTSLSPQSPKKKLRVSKDNSDFKIGFGNINENFDGSCFNLEPISNRASLVLDISCSNCKGKKEIAGYLCNHNSCIFCTVNSCLKEIFIFFQQYQADQNIIKKDFHYKCPVQECKKIISVPTLMVLKNHMKFMNDPEYSARNKVFEFIKPENILPWVPYFDGLSAWSVYD